MKGSCLCKAVQYQVIGKPGDAVCCHCIQCRKQSGHFFAASSVPDSSLDVSGEVRWYASSDRAKRGFCPKCGSCLFWKHIDEDTISVSLGSVDGETGLELSQHLFTAFKGDYYEITDGVPQFDVDEGVQPS